MFSIKKYELNQIIMMIRNVCGDDSDEPSLFAVRRIIQIHILRTRRMNKCFLESLSTDCINQCSIASATGYCKSVGGDVIVLS